MRKKRPNYCWKSKGPWRSSNNTFNMFKSFNMYIVKSYKCLNRRQNIYQQSSILTFTLILKAEYLLTETINFGISLIACSHNIYDNLYLLCKGQSSHVRFVQASAILSSLIDIWSVSYFQTSDYFWTIWCIRTELIRIIFRYWTFLLRETKNGKNNIYDLNSYCDS